MNDSRAALEQRARIFLDPRGKNWKEDITDFADFAEQESSSLKLLLSAMCRGRAQINQADKYLLVSFRSDARRVIEEIQFPVELDSSGIPVITEEILEALEAAK